MLKKKNNQGRVSVSAEVYGTFNKKGDYKPKVIHKNEDQIARINTRLDQAFMFSGLDKLEKEIVINAFDEVKFAAGEPVI